MKNVEEIGRLAPQALKELLRQRWPEAVKVTEEKPLWMPKTGIPELNALFPPKGLPKGTCLAILGSRSSGKVSLAFLLARDLVRERVKAVFVDCPGTFFPPAAALAGINLGSIVVVRPPNLLLGLRTAEGFTSVAEVGVIIVNAGATPSPFPERLLKRFQAAALSRKIPVLLLKEQRSIQNEDKRIFPFLLSVRRALAVTDFETGEKDRPRSCYVRVKVEADKRGVAGKEVVVNLYANAPSFVPVRSQLPVGRTLSK